MIEGQNLDVANKIVVEYTWKSRSSERFQQVSQVLQNFTGIFTNAVTLVS